MDINERKLFKYFTTIEIKVNNFGDDSRCNIAGTVEHVRDVIALALNRVTRIETMLDVGRTHAHTCLRDTRECRLTINSR